MAQLSCFATPTRPAVAIRRDFASTIAPPSETSTPMAVLRRAVSATGSELRGSASVPYSHPNGAER
jgi:hypothetical protein